MMVESFSSPVANGLALTLLHFLWQGLLIAIAYWALRAATGIRSTRIRYATSLLALGVMALCPLVTFAVVYDSAVAVDEVPTQSATSSDWADTSAAPVMTHQTGSASPDSQAANEAGSEFGETGGDRRGLTAIQWALDASRPFVLILWLAGVMLSGARLTGGILNVLLLRSGRILIPSALVIRSRHFAHRLGLAGARVFASTRIREAAVVGFWRPVVLLPAWWLTSLPTDVLEAVIAHELAHIRRYDVWVNLLQRVVETLLFYHPAVWWLSNRIRLEREMCCDELAVEATGERGSYVMALEQVGRLQVRGTLTLAASFTGDRKMKLLSRVQNVLKTPGKPQREPVWLVGVIAIAMPVLFMVAGGVSADANSAVAQERENGRSEEEEAGPPQPDESEAGPLRSAEVEQTISVPDGGSVLPGGIEQGFKPQTQREAALFKMVEDLQREMAELRSKAQSHETGERTPEYAQWFVQIADDLATVKANKQTKSEFVEATISALQESGVKKFALGVQEPDDKTGKATQKLSIRVVDGIAEISPSNDLPYKYLVAVIQKLQEAGVENFKFTTRGNSTEELEAYPVSDRIDPISVDEKPQADAQGVGNEFVLPRQWRNSKPGKV
jgi:bla regulator protein blaR1